MPSKISIKSDPPGLDAKDVEMMEEDSDDDSGNEMKPCKQEPTFFTDNRGNLKVVNVVVRHPCKILWALLLICFLLTFALYGLVIADGNPFRAPGNEFDIHDVRSIQFDSFRLARDAVQEGQDTDDETSEQKPKQSEVADALSWVYESETPNGVFGSRESIQAMKDSFDVFLQDEAFPDWCLLDYRTSVAEGATRGCATPLTPLRMYYASAWDPMLVKSIMDELNQDGRIKLFNSLSVCTSLGLYCELIPESTTQADIEWTTNMASNIKTVTASWDMKGDLVTDYTQATEFATYILQLDSFKGLLDVGYDKGFSSENPVSQYSRGMIHWGGPLQNYTLDSEGDDARNTYVIDNYLEKMDVEADPDKHLSINTYYLMASIIGEVILGVVVQDALLALFSFLFILFWLRVNTGSWFLAAIGFLEIFLSIPISWFFFAAVFQINYFGPLNSLAIFIVAAIGADDIFIFMDAYKLSKLRDPENLVDMETRMSWVYRRTGTAMAITSATTCSAFLCTLITPLTSIQSFGVFAAIVILIDYALVMSLFCTAVVIYHDRFENRAKLGCCCPCDTMSPSNTEIARKELEEYGVDDARGDRVSRFFRNEVSGFVKKSSNRMIMGVIFVIWISIAIWQTTQLEATQEAEQFLAEDNPLQKSITILNAEFPAADEDEGLKVYYAWGLGEVSRDGVNLLLDPDFFGEAKFEETFDFNAECQSELLSFCELLKTDSNYKELVKQTNGLGAVYCFMEELAAYNVRGNLDDCEYVRSGGWKEEQWQVDPSNLPSIMEGFLQSKSCFNEDGTETVSRRYKNEIGWDGTSLKYAAVSAESGVLTALSRAPEATTRREYDEFIALSVIANTMVSEHCSSNVVVTDLDQKFVFMNNQVIYVQSAIQSSILGVVIAFFVLLTSTRVLHIAFFASLSICSVLVSVVGTMVMMGWSLGSIESILIGITAGFSVDYVVHLAHAYEIADGDTYERLEEAFADLGISVFNGMLTSVAASIPLFFCQLQFFAKFGTFLCLTIAFSWIFANFGFMCLLAGLKIPIKKGGCRL
ncbi:MAG: hypothetical protein SGBAC_002648 [Bacillariaceae sp.]